MRCSATFACAVGVLLTAAGAKAHGWHKHRYYPVAPVGGAAFVPSAGFNTSAFVPSAGFNTSAFVPSAGFTTMALVPSAGFAASSFGCQGGAAASFGAGTAQSTGIDPTRLLELGLPFLERLLNRQPLAPFGGVDPALGGRLASLEGRVSSLEQKVANIEDALQIAPAPGRRRIVLPDHPSGPFGSGSIGSASVGGDAAQVPAARDLLQATKVIDSALDQLQDDYLHRAALHKNSARKGSNRWKGDDNSLNQVKDWLKKRGNAVPE